jgi:hypothetical protein
MALVVTYDKTLDQVAGRERTTFGSLAMDALYRGSRAIGVKTLGLVAQQNQ